MTECLCNKRYFEYILTCIPGDVYIYEFHFKRCVDIIAVILYFKSDFGSIVVKMTDMFFYLLFCSTISFRQFLLCVPYNARARQMVDA